MKIHAIIGLLIMLVCSGCGSLRVYVESDPDFDIAAYTSYDWNMLPADSSELQSVGNPVVDSLVRKFINSEMKLKGYQLSSTNAALQVHRHIVLEEKSLAPTESDLYENNALWIRNDTDPFYFEQGTFIIDVVDKQTGCLIWRSRGVALIENITPNNLEHRTFKSVQKMLRRLPKSSALSN